jgi:DNA-binding Lrp family transcriptional regulator
MKIDERLLEFATERQAQFVNSVNGLNSIRAAALALGCDESTIRNSIKRLKKSATIRGYSPAHDMVHSVPEGYLAKGVSTYYDSDGKPRGQWVKSAIDHNKLNELMQEMWGTFAADLPKAPKIAAPSLVAEHLCNVYTFTDYHMGMLAWHEEGGADWDMKIAENLLRDSFLLMMQRCPPAKKAVINIQGDFLHTDGLTAVTPGHGHILDADSRYRKMCLVALRIIKEMVSLALTQHEEVELLICEGNHDESGSGWMQLSFMMHFEDNPRVTVHSQALPYYAIQWGTTMLAFHHGHKLKNEQLPLLFAAQFASMWGETTKRYCNTGHRHHLEIKEHSGMTVTQHPTLSARDAYASRGGWYSERAAIGLTFHDKYGKWDEKWVTPEMVEGLKAND